MGSPLRTLVAAIASRLGYFASKRTSLADLRRVVELLRPVDAGHRLVRIGGDGDGGYLLPEDLGGIAACFSPGVDRQATFENALARFGIGSHLADRSVAAPPPEPPEIVRRRKQLAVELRAGVPRDVRR